jgi:hypothetical protein
MRDQPAEQQDQYRKSLHEALLLIEDALDILDRAKAPDAVCAHIDMGRHRLEAYLCLDD